MVDRVGNWYAFSRSSFCRCLTLYEDLPWQKPTPVLVSEVAANSECAKPSQSFSLATAELVAVAPFGGPIAVLSRTADVTVSSPSFTLVNSSSSPAPPPLSSSAARSARPYFNLSAHSACAAAASRSIHVFTSAGELLISFPLTSQEVGQDTIKTLGWTPEGELFFLLEPLLTVVFLDMRDVAVKAGGPSPSPSSGPDVAVASRRVQLRPRNAAACSENRPPLAALCVSSAGLLCVEGDGSGQLYGLLHEEKFSSVVVPSVSLPLHGSAASVPWQPRVAAVEMVPPAWNDSGDFLVLWAQHDVAAAASKNTKKGQSGASSHHEGTVVTALCAMVLPDADLLDGDDDDVNGVFDASAAAAPKAAAPRSSASFSSTSAARVACAGRVLSLSVCVSDPTRVAAFTSLGVLHVLRSNLSCRLYAIDLGLCRVLRDVVARTATAPDGDDGYYGGLGSVPLSSQSFAFGDVTWRQRDFGVGNNTSFAGGNGGDDGVGPTGLSFATSLTPPAEGGGESRSGAGDSAVACPPPHRLEWCGGSFILLSFFLADFQAQPQSRRSTNSNSDGGGGGGGGDIGCSTAVQRQDAPMFSLLVCTQKGCSVRCERLDWSLDGSGHIATVAEQDGVRVVSDTACYFIQEVPPCLARLCRVQPPFSPAAQVVLAYQAYMNGDRHGIAQVRAALSFPAPASASVAGVGVSAAVHSDGVLNVVNDNDDDDDRGDDNEEEEMSYAEGIVYELLDAASYEFDAEQQYRLVAAASFAGETIHLRSGVPDVIVDVVRRLRVLRAVREEVCCHIPLTMGQYQVLTGSEERPARPLSSLEGSVLVDRLAYMGYYQLALDVVRALHMKPNRVLSRWASSFVRRHIADMSDAALHLEVAQVLTQYPAASYIEPATTAFHLGRRDLALRLLRDEPQQQRERVMLCVKMGELAMAGRAAAASGSAELIHLVVCALVAKEAQTHHLRVAKLREQQQQRDGDEAGPSMAAAQKSENMQSDADDGDGATDVTAGDVYHCLIASPELLCWLLVGAQCLASWQSMAQRLLLSRHWTLASLGCQQMLVQCLRLTSAMHRAQLQQYMAETAGGARQLRKRRGNAAGQGGQGGGDEEEEDTAGDPDHSADGKREKQLLKREERRKKNKKKRHHRKKDCDEADSSADGDGESDDIAGSDEEGGTGGAAIHAHPPPLSIPVPTAHSAAAALTEWMRKTKCGLLKGLQQAEELRRANTAARLPFSVVLKTAEQLQADLRKAAAQDNEDAAPESRSRRRHCTAAAGLAGGEEGSASSSSLVWAHVQCVRTSLSTPTTPPLKDADALKKELDLSKLKVSLAVKHNAPRLSRVVSVADLVYELCGLEDGEADAADVRRVFHVNEKMFFYAKLRGMCAAQRWAAVDAFLGQAPPLRKRSFFSVSGSGGAAKTPCIGYLPVVHLLTEYKQEERAARYVAGACSEAVDRVVLYMSLGAPVMALEAAMVDKDAGLIQQIMQRVPDSAKVQSVGTQMLNELRDDD